jgi:hypothetical protein
MRYNNLPWQSTYYAIYTIPVYVQLAGWGWLPQDILTLNEDDLNFFPQENERLEIQLRTLKRVNDKLKDEQRSASGRKPVLQQHNPPVTKGKENVDHSPVQKSPVSSPSLKSLRKCR